MKMIEKGLAEVHADFHGSNGERPGTAPTTSRNSHVGNGHVGNGHVGNGHIGNGYMSNRSSSGDTVATEPFAIVTMVSDESPADLAVSMQ